MIKTTNNQNNITAVVFANENEEQVASTLNNLVFERCRYIILADMTEDAKYKSLFIRNRKVAYQYIQFMPGEPVVLEHYQIYSPFDGDFFSSILELVESEYTVFLQAGDLFSEGAVEKALTLLDMQSDSIDFVMLQRRYRSNIDLLLPDEVLLGGDEAQIPIGDENFMLGGMRGIIYRIPVNCVFAYGFLCDAFFYTAEDLKDLTAILICHESVDNALQTLQNLFANNCMQIILLDCSDRGYFDEISVGKNCCQHYTYIKSAKKSLGLNQAVELASGSYTVFMEEGDQLGENTAEEALRLLSENETCINCAIAPYGNRSFTDSTIVDVREGEAAIHKRLRGTFFRTDIVNQCEFREDFNIYDDIKTITDIILATEAYGYLGKKYTYHVRKDMENRLEASCKPRKWFFESLMMADYLLEDEEISPYEYNAAFSILNDLFSERNTKGVFCQSDIDILWNQLYEILLKFDDEFILEQKGKPGIDSHLLFALLKLKHRDNITFGTVASKDDVLYTASYAEDVGAAKHIYSLSKRSTHVNIVEIEKDHLHISGYFTSIFPVEGLEIVAEAGKERVVGVINEYAQFSRYIVGKKVIPSYYFDIVLPLAVGKTNGVRLYWEYGIAKLPVLLMHTHKSTLAYFTNMYYCDNTWLMKMKGKSGLEIHPFSMKKINEWETQLGKELNAKKEPQAVTALDYRQKIIASIEKFKNRRIWLFSDSVNRADDNGEHLFRYALRQADGIEKYFVLSKESADYPRMKRLGNTIAYGSVEHILLLCFCEKLISSHIQYLKVECDYLKCFRGFMTTRQSFLQHGVIKDGNNNLFDDKLHNFDFFLASAKQEYDYILQNSIGVVPPVLKLTGMPRYDSLYSQTDKKILIAFTWRYYLVSKRNTHGDREYNPNFKETEYFREINGLINDAELLQAANRMGYTLCFRPHPYMYQQIEDFDTNEITEFVSEDCSYQDLYCECDLMVTDYSSAFFDFSYLKKPVVYYQFDENHYEHGYYNWENMGFGEVVRTRAELVKLIIKHMENGCRMNDTYLDRVESFFSFRDRANCKRVYAELSDMSSCKLNMPRYNDVTVVIYAGEFTEEVKRTVEAIAGYDVKQVIVMDTTLDGEWSGVVTGDKSGYRYISVAGYTKGKALNEATARAEGKFITYMDAGESIDEGAISNALEFLERNTRLVNFVAIPVRYTHYENREYPYNFRFQSEGVTDVSEKYNFTHRTFRGTFFKTDAVKRYLFDERLVYCEDLKLLTNVLMEKEQYGIVASGGVYWSNEQAERELEEETKDADWFFEKMDLLEKMVECTELSRYQQKIVMEELKQVLKEPNTQDGLFTDEQIGSLWHMLEIVAAGIADEVILETKGIDINCLYALLRLKDKNSNNLSFIISNLDLRYAYQGYYINSLSKNPITITIVEVRSNMFHMAGYWEAIFPMEQIRIVAHTTNGAIEGRIKPYWRFERFIMGEKVSDCYSINIIFPLSGEDDVIDIYWVFDNLEIPVRLIHNFKSPLSYFEHMYYCDGKWLVKKKSHSGVLIKRKTGREINEFEKLLVEEIKNKYPEQADEAVALRREYIDNMEMSAKRRIWLFADRATRADDNAEHLFRYATQQDDDIEKFFVLAQNCSDFERMKKHGNVVEFGSKEHLLLLFACEKLVSSHLQYIKVFFDQYKFYTGFIITRQAFLQHGIIKDDNRNLTDLLWFNFTFFLTSARGEYDYLYQSGQDITKDVLKLTGMPRFDNLTNEPKKKVFISFTWRRYLVAKRGVYGERGYNKNFVNTNYFKKVNELISDEKLISVMERLGYTICLRLHPNASQQAKDFKASEFVEIVPDTVSYQELYKECQLMITDYSSAYFDFSYLRKPVIYYQFEKNHLKNGYFDWETMGFGEVVKEHDEMVDLLIDYMENDCKIKDMYKLRIEEFYEYNDRKNCQRVYTELLNQSPDRLNVVDYS